MSFRPIIDFSVTTYNNEILVTCGTRNYKKSGHLLPTIGKKCVIRKCSVVE